MEDRPIDAKLDIIMETPQKNEAERCPYRIEIVRGRSIFAAYLG